MEALKCSNVCDTLESISSTVLKEKAKQEKKIKKWLFPFLLVFPLILPDSPWRSFSFQWLPDSLAA